tara:strand:+ start:1252 stop:1857 length:606 start_codon:yes stop_codon:yes gene_type:complete
MEDPKTKMEDPKIKIKTVAIDSLEYDPLNVREHDERNIDAIKASLARFGQQKPIVVKKDGTVIAGNGTLGAMRMLGYKEVVIAETELDGEEAVAYAIADNRTAELASWDDQALAQALDQLGDELLPASGFSDDDMEELLNNLEPSDTDFPDLPDRGLRSVTLVMTHEEGEVFDRVMGKIEGNAQGDKVARLALEWETWQKK